MFKSAETIRKRSREIDRSLGNHAEAFSRFLWPWRERWLLLITGSFAVFDFLSTFAALNWNKEHTYESGALAAWALNAAGFPLLILVDITSAALLCLIAITAQRLYSRFGFKNYGRAAFVLFLVPYLVITGFAIGNNLVLAFL